MILSTKEIDQHLKDLREVLRFGVWLIECAGHEHIEKPISSLRHLREHMNDEPT
jgi:hypothetical protein